MPSDLLNRISDVWGALELPGPCEIFPFLESNVTVVTKEIRETFSWDDELLEETFLGRKFDEIEADTFISWGAFGSPFLLMPNRASAYYLGAIEYSLVGVIIPDSDPTKIFRASDNFIDVLHGLTASEEVFTSCLNRERAYISLEVLLTVKQYWDEIGNVFYAQAEMLGKMDQVIERLSGLLAGNDGGK